MTLVVRALRNFWPSLILKANDCAVGSTSLAFSKNPKACVGSERLNLLSASSRQQQQEDPIRLTIFNWVQRRFNHTVLKDGPSRSVKKTDGIVIDTDTKALLEQVPLVDVLDGILTIGTFGFDPLKLPWGEQKSCFASESDDEQGEEEQHSDNEDYSDSNEEENPLMLSSFDHGFKDMTMTVNPASEGSTNDEIRTKLDAIEGHSGMVRRRTTLADLFSEDSDSSMKKKPSSLESDSNCSRKGSVRTKQGLSFSKKLIPQVGEHSRPIKMLNQVTTMRRMLKKKIHPEFGGRGNKLNKQCSKKKHEASESAYLLEQSPGTATA
ncbi:protein TILLER ANGLE CONTROL 1-like [Hibiscus syriacus]|uniref:protein TILLER ANGLE CONTROL 1-like n=1 Tax=Hibiscus syriacus TaxID=106335 RepID=UPI0019213774|nr:protein TILLER ANGLE CONTROL 1-like [Hibiscus syriacus]